MSHFIFSVVVLSPGVARHCMLERERDREKVGATNVGDSES